VFTVQERVLGPGPIVGMRLVSDSSGGKGDSLYEKAKEKVRALAVSVAYG
jgi:hypothetical protein